MLTRERREQHHGDRQRQRDEEAVAHVALHRRRHRRVGHVVRHPAVPFVRRLLGRLVVLRSCARVCGSSYCMRSHFVPQVIGASCAECASRPVGCLRGRHGSGSRARPHRVADGVLVDQRGVVVDSQLAALVVDRGRPDPVERPARPGAHCRRSRCSADPRSRRSRVRPSTLLGLGRSRRRARSVRPFEAAQAERVAYDGDARERHRDTGDQRIQ